MSSDFQVPGGFHKPVGVILKMPDAEVAVTADKPPKNTGLVVMVHMEGSHFLAGSSADWTQLLSLIKRDDGLRVGGNPVSLAPSPNTHRPSLFGIIRVPLPFFTIYLFGGFGVSPKALQPITLEFRLALFTTGSGLGVLPRPRPKGRQGEIPITAGTPFCISRRISTGTTETRDLPLRVTALRTKIIRVVHMGTITQGKTGFGPICATKLGITLPVSA